MLAYPFALAKGGWASLAIFGSLAAATRLTASQIALCIDTCGGPKKCRTYADLGYAAFGLPGAALITGCFFMELIGAACAGYVVVFADNVHALNSHHAVAFYSCVAVLVILPTTWFRDLSYLSFVSFIGVVSACILTVVVLYSGISASHAPGSLHDVQQTEALRIENIPFTLGVWMAGFAGHAVVPQLYCSMAKPKQFGSVLNISYSVVMPLYLSVAVSAYLMYGEGVQPQVTLSLPEGIVTDLCLYMIILNCVCKFALTLAPVSEVVEGVIDQLRLRPRTPVDKTSPKSDLQHFEVSSPFTQITSPEFTPHADSEVLGIDGWETPLLKQNATPRSTASSPPHARRRPLCAKTAALEWLRMVTIRAILCGVILSVAILVPDFDRLLSFCGSLLSFTVSIAFPPLAYNKLHSDTGPLTRMANWALGLIGVILALVGTTASVLQ